MSRCRCWAIYLCRLDVCLIDFVHARLSYPTMNTDLQVESQSEPDPAGNPLSAGGAASNGRRPQVTAASRTPNEEAVAVAGHGRGDRHGARILSGAGWGRIAAAPPAACEA